MADEAAYQYDSVIRGHHIYKRLWSAAAASVELDSVQEAYSQLH